MEKNITIDKFYKSKTTLKILYVLSVVGVAFVYLFSISKIEVPIILPDEFGNISNAMYFRGINWGNVVKYVGYYGFGSSLFYTPLSLLCATSTGFYKGTIILNTLLIIIGNFILIKISKRFTNDKIYPLNIILSTAAMCYASYIGYANGAMYETIILFTFILSFYSAIKIYETSLLRWIVLYSFLLVYCVMIHLRLIAILFTGIIVFLFFVYKKKVTIKESVLFAVIILIGLTMMLLIKQNLVTNVWQNSTNSQYNSFGVVANIKQLFTLYGFKKFLVILFGQFFYMGVSTFLLGWVAIIHSIKFFCMLIKKTTAANELDIVSFFLVLNYLCQIFIVCIFFIDWKRMDQVFYGRYSEYNYALLLVAGFCIIMQNCLNLKKILTMSVGLYFIGDCLNHYLATVTFPASPTCASVISFWRFLDYYSNNYSGTSLNILKILLIVIPLSMIILLLASKKEITFKIAAVIILGCSTALNGVWYTANYVSGIASIHYANKAIANQIENSIGDSVTYLCDMSSINLNNISSVELLQFGLYDKIVNIEDFNDYDFSDNLVLTPQINVFDSELYKSVYTPTYGVHNMLIWEKSDNDEARNSYDMLGVGFYSNNKGFSDYTNGYVISNGQHGTLAFGPYSSFSKGEYEFVLDLLLLKSLQDDIGYFEVYGDGKTLFSRKLVKTDFDADGKAIIELPVLLLDDVESIQFRTIVYGSVELQFNKLTIKKYTDSDLIYNYDFTLDEHMFISDFSSIEQGGRWATSISPTLIAFLPDEDMNMTVSFGYTLPFEQLGVDSYDIDILMNDNKIGQITLFPGSEKTFVLPVSSEFIEDGSNKINFVGEFEWSPADYGSADTRTLSFALQKITFEPAASLLKGKFNL